MPAIPAHPNVLSGARVLVFGGTTGIGQGVASAALANGAKVFVSSSNPDKVAAATAGMRETYPGAAVGGTAADLANGATIEANVEKVLQAAVAELGGPLDHIVWTAGDAFNQESLADVTAENAFLPWNVRYLGPLMLTKLLSGKPGTYLKVESTSSITLTSGILGTRPMKGLSRAVGWCGAIETMTRTLAIDLAPIRTNSVAPGAILTPMLEQLGQEAISGFASQHLVQKIGQTSEIAEAYLLSMRCAFVTGQLFTIDGGYTYK